METLVCVLIASADEERGQKRKRDLDDEGEDDDDDDWAFVCFFSCQAVLFLTCVSWSLPDNVFSLFRTAVGVFLLLASQSGFVRRQRDECVKLWSSGPDGRFLTTQWTPIL